MSIAIIDYGTGNLRSVQKALEKLGFEASITSDNKKIKDSTGIILPGVGAFDSAITSLKENDTSETMMNEIKKGKPFLGLCLGMQLLFETSEEGSKKGLGLFKGKVVKFNFGKKTELKIPHMGWNNISFKKDSPLLKGVTNNTQAYFVHSYYCVPEDTSLILTETDYGIPFASSIAKDNIFALQFHPEKSSDEGLKILNNFGKECK